MLHQLMSEVYTFLYEHSYLNDWSVLIHGQNTSASYNILTPGKAYRITIDDNKVIVDDKYSIDTTDISNLGTYLGRRYDYVRNRYDDYAIHTAIREIRFFERLSDMNIDVRYSIASSAYFQEISFLTTDLNEIIKDPIDTSYYTLSIRNHMLNINNEYIKTFKGNQRDTISIIESELSRILCTIYLKGRDGIYELKNAFDAAKYRIKQHELHSAIEGF